MHPSHKRAHHDGQVAVLRSDEQALKALRCDGLYSCSSLHPASCTRPFLSPQYGRDRSIERDWLRRDCKAALLVLHHTKTAASTAAGDSCVLHQKQRALRFVAVVNTTQGQHKACCVLHAAAGMCTRRP